MATANIRAPRPKGGEKPARPREKARPAESGESRRRRSESRILLVNAEMLARQLYYSAGYLAACRKRLAAA